MDIQHSAAKMVVEVAKTQDDEVGDGTTSSVINAGELLGLAEELIDKNFPTVIIDIQERGITEPLKVKIQAIKSVTEVVSMILRIDDVIEVIKPK